jgi:hypothetical protein
VVSIHACCPQHMLSKRSHIPLGRLWEVFSPNNEGFGGTNSANTPTFQLWDFMIGFTKLATLSSI